MRRRSPRPWPSAVLLASLATLVAGCSSTAGGAPVGLATAAASHGPSSPASPSGPASPNGPASGSGSALLASLVPYPAGARPWVKNKTGVLGLDAFVDNFYVAKERATSRSLTVARGFDTSVRRGWINADGTQAEVWLVRFHSAAGARSMYLSVTANWKKAARPTTTFADTEVHGTGELIPKLDSLGNAPAKVATCTGRVFAYVMTFAPASPDKAVTTSLMRRQYALLDTAV